MRVSHYSALKSGFVDRFPSELCKRAGLNLIRLKLELMKKREPFLMRGF